MSLQDWTCASDKFEPEDEGLTRLAFPCCACKHNRKTDADEPCRTCDHNVNAVKPDAPSEKYPIPGAPFDEPMPDVVCPDCGVSVFATLVEPIAVARRCATCTEFGDDSRPERCACCGFPAFKNWTAKEPARTCGDEKPKGAA
jgi:hypothetical protein